MYFGLNDPTIILLIPAILFTIFAQTKVKRAYSRYSQVANRNGMTGMQAARMILDHNGMQIDGTNDEVMSLGDIRAKAEAFGYDVIEVADGNDMQQVLDALKTPACPGKPRYILMNTLKGKGVSYMEGQVGWHGKAPNAEQAEQALKELEG